MTKKGNPKTGKPKDYAITFTISPEPLIV